MLRIAPMMVATKPGRQGERGVSRKTIRAGSAGLFRRTCSDYARVLSSFARETAGAKNTRHSLRPLFRGTCFARLGCVSIAGMKGRVFGSERSLFTLPWREGREHREARCEAGWGEI
jgi:hypothetical protein